MNNFKEIVLNFPKQFRAGLKAAVNVKPNGRFKAILICAMGGSALPAEILNIYFEEQKIKTPLVIHKDYGLPYRVNENHLVVCISYSGNTEETISAYQEAVKRNLAVAAIASGGELAKLCDKNKTLWAQMPPDLPPRMALGYQFGALLKLIINAGLLPKEAESELLNSEKKLEPLKLKVQAKELAKKLEDKIPIIYSSGRLKPLAYIWKIKFNENSKIPAFYNYFPELNHNEMSALESRPKNFHLIILRDPTDSPKILKRMQLTASISRSKGTTVDFVDLKKGGFLFKIFDNLLLSDWTSYYVAVASGKDPVTLKLTEEFKKKL